MRIDRDDPAVVMLAPDEEKAWLWGVFQFPKVWNTEDGRLQFRVNVAQDTYGGIGVHEPAWFYESNDSGESWRRIESNRVESPKTRARLPDGTEIALVQDMVSNAHELHAKIDVRALGVDSVFDHMSVNRVGWLEYYRYGDVPARERRFSMLRRRPDGAWHEFAGVLEAPELLTRAVTATRMGRNDSWQPVKPEAARIKPTHLVATADGTLLSTACTQAADMRGRRFDENVCIASEDGGLTWHLRATIADDKTLATDGYSGYEDSLVRLSDGTLLCAMRTDMCSLYDSGSMYTALSISEDEGYTWSVPHPIAESSVTPHLVVLRDDVVVLVHGRPGVHLAISDDGGRHWDYRARIVGSTVAEISEKARLAGEEVVRMYEWHHGHESCSNTDVCPLDAESFLVAYSDFGRCDESGTLRKANLVRRVLVTT